MDSIYESINKDLSKQQISQFLLVSKFADSDIKQINKIAFLVPTEYFKKIFNMIRYNVILPMDLIDIESYDKNYLDVWIHTQLSKNYFLDRQSVRLDKKLEVDNLLKEMGLFANRFDSTKSVGEFISYFDYINRENLKNSYQSIANFKEDFDSKMGIDGDETSVDSIEESDSPLKKAIYNLEQAFDNSDDSLSYATDIEALFDKLIVQTVRSCFQPDNIYKLCMATYFNEASIEIFRMLFADLINWKFPFKNFEDVRNELYDIFYRFQTTNERAEEIIRRIGEAESKLNIYTCEFNRCAILLLVYFKLTGESSSPVVNYSDVKDYFENNVFTRLDKMNEILKIIQTNKTGLKLQYKLQDL